MKKTLTLFLVAFFGLVLTAGAQIERGNVLAGADIANFNIGLSKPSYFNIKIDPKFGFFIKDNVTLGPYVNFGVFGSSGNTTVTYGVGAFGRWYANGKNNVSPIRHSLLFGEANIGIGGQSNPGGGSTTGLGFGFGPGFSYFVTPNIGLEALLKYNGNAGFGSQPYSSTLDLNFGFQIYLPSRGLKAKVMNDVK